MDFGDLGPHRLENLRRSIVMLPPGHPGLDRNEAIRVIEELQRLHASRQDLVNQLRLLLDRWDHPSG